jgi:hypothetical protein
MTWRLRLFGGLVLLTAVVLTPASAQQLSDGWSAFEPKYNKVRLKARGFIAGAERVDPQDKSHVEALDLLAKFYTYGVYLQDLESKRNGKDGIHRAYQDFEGDVDKILKAKERDSVQGVSEVFRDRVRVHALEVLQFEKARPIHKVHNARLLAKVAELGQGDLVDTLVKVLKDRQQNDGVRYYVLRGLGTLLAQVQPMQMPPVLSAPQQTQAIEALVQFLEETKGPSKKASPEEIDGFRLLRREAVRALAHVHTPMVNAKVRPALVLARFAGADERIQPPPRLDERAEAVLGLARMQSAQDKQYQADYAAGQIAKCVGAFADAYSKEREQKDNLTLPWRVTAARLSDALTALQTDSGKNAHVAEVIKRGKSVLAGVTKGAQINAEDVTWLATSQSDSPSKELFNGVSDSVVKPAEGAEAAPDK